MILDMILGCLGHGFWDMLGYRVEWFLLGFWMRDSSQAMVYVVFIVHIMHMHRSLEWIYYM